MTRTGLAILWALKQVGKSYTYGAEVLIHEDAVGDTNAYADVIGFDCSELVQIAMQVAGVIQVGICPVLMFDGAAQQYAMARHVHADGSPILVSEVKHRQGALLFVQDAHAYPDKANHIGHVAMVCAPGYVVEARGRHYGVCISMIRPSFNLAAVVDELAEEV